MAQVDFWEVMGFSESSGSGGPRLIVQARVMCAARANQPMIVSRWGRPGLQSGDWVMKDRASWWNYVRSGKLDPGPWNQFAPKSSGQEFVVPRRFVRWPMDKPWWHGDGPIMKGVLGQRRYIEATIEASPK